MRTLEELRIMVEFSSGTGIAFKDDESKPFHEVLAENVAAIDRAHSTARAVQGKYEALARDQAA